MPEQKIFNAQLHFGYKQVKYMQIVIKQVICVF